MYHRCIEPPTFERGLEVSTKRAASSSASSEGEAHTVGPCESGTVRVNWLGAAWIRWQSQIDLPCQAVQCSRVRRVPLSYANGPRFGRVQRSFRLTGCRHRGGGEDWQQGQQRLVVVGSQQPSKPSGPEAAQSRDRRF